MMVLAIPLSIGSNKCTLQVTSYNTKSFFAFCCTNARITSDYESCKSEGDMCSTRMCSTRIHIRTRHIYLVPIPIFQNMSRNILYFPILFFDFRDNTYEHRLQVTKFTAQEFFNTITCEHKH